MGTIDGFELDLPGLCRALLRRAKGVAGTVLAFGLAGFLLAEFAVPPLYEAQTLLYVDVTPFEEEESLEAGELAAARELVQTGAVLSGSSRVLEETARRAGVEESPEQLGRRIEGEAVRSTGLLRLKAVDHDPAEARRLAEISGQVLAETFAEVSEGSVLRVADPAVLPERPISPGPVKYTAVGLLTGLVLSVGTVILLEQMDKTLRSPEELRRFCGLPVLAVIPASSDRESWRMLSTGLTLHGERPALGIAGTCAGTAAGHALLRLGEALAGEGKKVLLLEGDFHSPFLAQALSLEDGPGLGELLTGDCRLPDALHRDAGRKGLDVIPAGRGTLLRPGPMEELLRECRYAYDLILLSLPDGRTCADALAMSPLLSALVLTVCPGRTLRTAPAEAEEQLRQGGTPVLGVVCMEEKAPAYSSGRQGKLMLYAPERAKEEDCR